MKASNAPTAYAYRVLVEAEMNMDEKEQLYAAMTKSSSRMNAISIIEKTATSSAMMGALTELCQAQWDEKERY